MLATPVTPQMSRVVVLKRAHFEASRSELSRRRVNTHFEQLFTSLTFP